MSKISDFTTDSKNANKGTQRGLRALDTSLRQYGAGRSILVDKNGKVIAGNKTLERAADIGLDDVIVVESDGTKLVAVKRTDLDLDSEDGKARALATYDNRVGQLDLDWDVDALKNVDSDVLKDLWSVDELDKMGVMDKPEGDAEPQIDRAAELQEKWQVKTGDLWRIGDHRLLCGDSTKREDVEKVMGGEKARMIFADPPYGMNLDTDYSGITGPNKSMVKGNGIRGRNYAPVIGDDSEFNPTSILDIFADVDEIFMWGGDYYSKYLPLGGWFVWDKCVKEDGTLSVGAEKMIGSNFELCWSKHKHKREIVRMYHRGMCSVDSSARVHPTQKPIQLAEWFITKFGDGIIIDPFIGSGTTIVACQNLGRKCRAIEISPEYCAVTLERMATAFPGIEIERLQVTEINSNGKS